MPIKPIGMYPDWDKVPATRKGLKAWLHRLNPLPIHYQMEMRFEAKQAWIRWKSRGIEKRFRGVREMKLNIGPGPHARPGWVNVDIEPEPHINCLCDCRKHLPFDDESVKCIFMEHVFEHIDYTDEVPVFLTECHRVLENGGVLRIIVPDAERYLHAYCQDGWDALSKLRGMDEAHRDPFMKCQYRTKMEVINMVFRQGFEHKYAYDFETLAFVLKRYGFETVVRQSYGVSTMEGLALDRESRERESLYVEAVKT